MRASSATCASPSAKRSYVRAYARLWRGSGGMTRLREWRRSNRRRPQTSGRSNDQFGRPIPLVAPSNEPTPVGGRGQASGAPERRGEGTRLAVAEGESDLGHRQTCLRKEQLRALDPS